MISLHKINIFLSLVFLCGSISTAQEPDQSEGKPKKEIPYLDVQIVPVGNVPLARFGRNKNAKPSALPVHIKGGPGAVETESPSENAPSSSSPQFSVIVQPDDERPPSRFYVKSGGIYLVVNCHQNSIGTPVRIPLTSSEVVFYKMKRNQDGTESYKKAFSYEVKPNQKRVLFTLSKPLKEKKWTKAKMKSYDLSPSKLNDVSALLINSSVERYIGGKVDKEAFALSPARVKLIRSDPDKMLRLNLAASSNKRKWSRMQRLSLPAVKDETHVILAYSVSPKESSRGFKVTRGKLVDDGFRIPSKHKPRN